MLSTHPTLHLLCGKVASGKSTLSAKLGKQSRTVIIAEDQWLAKLYSDEMASVSDYVTYSARLRTIMKEHIVSLLNAGTSVVLDFQANTVDSRKWMLEIIQTTNVLHQLHYLNVSDEVCKTRLRERNLTNNHPFKVTPEQFDLITAHFVAPTDAEGFEIVLHNTNNQN